MNPTKQRLLDLGRGWEGSDAAVTLSAEDALALGVKAERGKVPAVRGGDVLALARQMPDVPDAAPAPAEPAKTKK